jgi:uncharacterized membrane protein YsdA (DUF1294 family)
LIDQESQAMLVAYMFIINAVTYSLFGFDKRAAERGDWRIPEKTLLMASALGGSVGAVMAQRRFRHKTQKQPFKALLYGIIVAQLALISTYFYAWF